MKRGSGIKDRDDRWSGIEILTADALDKIKPTDPLILAKQAARRNLNWSDSSGISLDVQYESDPPEQGIRYWPSAGAQRQYLYCFTSKASKLSTRTRPGRASTARCAKTERVLACAEVLFVIESIAGSACAYPKPRCCNERLARGEAGTTSRPAVVARSVGIRPMYGMYVFRLSKLNRALIEP